MRFAPDHPRPAPEPGRRPRWRLPLVLLPFLAGFAVGFVIMRG